MVSPLSMKSVLCEPYFSSFKYQFAYNRTVLTLPQPPFLKFLLDNNSCDPIIATFLANKPHPIFLVARHQS